MTFDDLDPTTKQRVASFLRKYNISYGLKNVLIHASNGRTRVWKKRDINKEHIRKLIKAVEDNDYIVKGRDNINMDFWVVKRETLKRLNAIYKKLEE